MTAPERRDSSEAWERRRVQVSLGIERSSLELLASEGVDAVTVEQIAAAAGISKRTFFRYFRNPRDVLAAVPRREALRMSSALLARPADESLVDGFHSWFREMSVTRDLSDPVQALEAETFALWSAVVRGAPEVVQSESRAVDSLTEELAEVVRVRLSLAPDDSRIDVLAAAFASVIWTVYVQSVADDATDELSDRLDRAFDALAGALAVPAVAPRA